MSIAIVTSVSGAIAELAALTLPNKLEYCLRHGYTLIADNQPYGEAVSRTDRLIPYLDRFDAIWTLDADAIITNMAQRIEEVPGLGDDVTVCYERIVDWNALNCGSMVWRDTASARGLLREIASKHGEWKDLPCGWQSWLGDWHGPLTCLSPKSMNSVEWTHPANSADWNPGSHWTPGDLVYHPCGVYPAVVRLRRIRERLDEVVR